MCAYGAFDQPTYTFDVTPLLPVLTDGSPHNFTLTVEGQGPGRSIHGNWFVSGNLALNLSSSPTTGTIDEYTTTSDVSTAGSVSRGNTSVDFVVTAERSLHISSTLHIDGEAKTASADIALAYISQQLLTDSGRRQVRRLPLEGRELTRVQTINQTSTGNFSSSVDGGLVASDRLSYPLSLSTIALPDAFRGSIDLSFARTSVFGDISSSTNTAQHATGNLTFNATTGRATGGVGETRQTLNFVGRDSGSGKTWTYHRDVSAANRSVVNDSQSGTLAGRLDPPSLTPDVGILGVGRHPLMRQEGAARSILQ